MTNSLERALSESSSPSLVWEAPIHEDRINARRRHPKLFPLDVLITYTTGQELNDHFQLMSQVARNLRSEEANMQKDAGGSIVPTLMTGERTLRLNPILPVRFPGIILLGPKSEKTHDYLQGRSLLIEGVNRSLRTGYPQIPWPRMASQ